MTKSLICQLCNSPVAPEAMKYHIAICNQYVIYDEVKYVGWPTITTHNHLKDDIVGASDTLKVLGNKLDKAAKRMEKAFLYEDRGGT